MRRYMKILAQLSIAALLITIVIWSIMQKPIAPQDTAVPQGP